MIDSSLLLALILLSSFSALIQTEERTFLENFLNPFRIFRKAAFRVQTAQIINSRNQRTLRLNNKIQPYLNETVPFPCPLRITRSKERPKSVHELRPGDIDVIGAIGDSVTAGFGLQATNLIQSAYESRELSFSVGGFGTWREYLTLPNILKVFNPKLIGYSTAPSLSIDRESQFNVAEGGAISENTPYMTKILLKRILHDSRVNVKEDWKMISYMIGVNDFCSEMCYKTNPESIVENHRRDLIQVLTYLRDNLPRTIVNIIPPPSVELFSTLRNIPAFCILFTHSAACPCINGLAYKKFQQHYNKIMKRWQQIEIEIANYPEFDKNDFTVIAQPFTINYAFPKKQNGGTDFSFLSEDCFHFSQKGNAGIANDLWNNIMEPVGKKHLDGGGIFKKFLCPTEAHPFIYTKRNSN